MKPLIVTIMGPTAIGKTDLAMRLYDQYPSVLISVDAMMVYQGMDIGTGKPSAALLARYPHALVDCVSPDDPFSVSMFLSWVMPLIEEAWASKKLPILVGGSMMYFHALIHGLSDLPQASPSIRKRIEDQANLEGWQALWQQLSAVDPHAAASIKPTDRQRIQRALEVYELTGLPLSTAWADTHSVLPSDAMVWQCVLLPKDRAWLYERINQRFLAMLAQGWVEEVRQLRLRYPNAAAYRSVGYRQIVSHLDGDIGFEEMIRLGQQATRQLAKRQWTWLRKWSNVHVYEVGEGDEPSKSIAQALGCFGVSE